MLMVFVEGALVGDRWKGKRAGDRFCGTKWQLTCASIDGQRQEEKSLLEGYGSRQGNTGAFGEHQSVGGSVIIRADKR